MSLIAYLPRFYAGYAEMAALLAAEDALFDTVYSQLPLLVTDNTVSAMQEDVLTRLETALGLTPSGTAEQRKALILAKMRGRGVLDRQKITEVIAAFAAGRTEAEIGFDAGTLRVCVPLRSGDESFFFDSIERALRPLVPAHIALDVERYYSSWAQITAGSADWGALRAAYADWGALRNVIIME